MKKKYYIIEKIMFMSNILFLLLLKMFPQKINNSRILLVRLDKIGDYILFRNYIESVSTSEKYYKKEIYLCGNEEWKDLSMFLDIEFVNHFIWVNRNKFKKNLFYKFQILFRIRKLGFNTAIESTYSREHSFGDLIIAASNATNRIGNSGELLKSAQNKRKFIYNKIYNQIIQHEHNNLFEFNRNKFFFEKLLNQKIPYSKPIINSKFDSCVKYTQSSFIIIAPGAGEDKRIWSNKNFSAIIEFLLSNYNLDIYLVGQKNESGIGNAILNFIKNKSRIKNLIGKTSLIELYTLVKECDFAITNDSGICHIAATLNKKFICISNGNHLGRFVPYPNEMEIKAIFIFPQSVITSDEDNYRFGSDTNINDISIEQVINSIELIF